VLTDFHKKKIGGKDFVHSDDQLRQRYATITKERGKLWKDIVVPRFREEVFPDATEDEIEKMKQDHNRKYWKAQEDQKRARQLHAEIMGMKKSIADSSATTSAQISTNIQKASDERKEKRQATRNQWQQLSYLELKGRKMQILHWGLTHLLMQRALDVDTALAQHLTGKPVIHAKENLYQQLSQQFLSACSSICEEFNNDLTEPEKGKGKEKELDEDEEKNEEQAKENQKDGNEQETEDESETDVQSQYNRSVDIPPFSTRSDRALAESYWPNLREEGRLMVWHLYDQSERLTEEALTALVQNETEINGATQDGDEGDTDTAEN
jgi:hypothetical protein